MDPSLPLFPRTSHCAVSRRPPRRGVALVVALATLLGSGAVSWADADPSVRDSVLAEQHDRLDALGGERDRLEATIVTLHSTDAEVTARLAAIDHAVERARRDLGDAHRTRTEAATEAQRLQRHVAELETTMEEIRATATERAVEAFMSHGTDSTTMALLSSSDLTELHRRVVWLDELALRDRVVLGDLAEVQAGVGALRVGVRSAEADAAEADRAARRALDELDALRVEQEELRAEVTARIAHAEAEAEALDRAEAEVRAIIAAREAALQAERDQRRAWRSQCAAGDQPVDDAGRPVSCAALDEPSAPSSLRWPAAGVVSSEFGPRWGRVHQGIDIAAPTGTPVGAAESGTAVWVGWVSGFGNTVIVDHGGGLITLYAHLDQLLASPGAWLEQGQQLGTVGSTGNSTGPHLHLETWRWGEPVDPRSYYGATSPPSG